MTSIIFSPPKLYGGEILETFVLTGLHAVGNRRVTWPKRDVCVCLVTFTNETKGTIIHENQNYVHAENLIVQTLRSLQFNLISSVKLYSNYSPCNECCNMIGKLNEDLEAQERQRGGGVRVPLTFVFSQLYNIARPSCWNRGCYKWGSNWHAQPRDNGASLCNLCSSGPIIRSFEMADWVALIELLALTDTKCGVETANLTSIRFEEPYNFWRDLEDAEVKRDFQILKAGFTTSARRDKTRLDETTLRASKDIVSGGYPPGYSPGNRWLTPPYGAMTVLPYSEPHCVPYSQTHWDMC